MRQTAAWKTFTPTTTTTNGTVPHQPPLKLNEHEPKDFLETLYQIWWRLPDATQEQIILLLAGNTEIVAEYTDTYNALLRICSSQPPSVSVLNQIKAHIFTCQMMTFSQRRLKLLTMYTTKQHLLTVDQKEILCGIVIHMVPVTIKETFSAPVDRMIAAGITNGADFDAFQTFIDLLHVTLQINANKSK